MKGEGAFDCGWMMVGDFWESCENSKMRRK
jgi:hypothetical protein